jgi:hypothetical protein
MPTRSGTSCYLSQSAVCRWPAIPPEFVAQQAYRRMPGNRAPAARDADSSLPGTHRGSRPIDGSPFLPTVERQDRGVNAHIPQFGRRLQPRRLRSHNLVLAVLLDRQRNFCHASKLLMLQKLRTFGDGFAKARCFALARFVPLCG